MRLWIALVFTLLAAAPTWAQTIAVAPNAPTVLTDGDRPTASQWMSIMRGQAASGIDASAHSVAPTGGGAARTIADRAADTVNLRDYLPLAGNDAAAAMVLAFNALPASGGVITVPYGQYSWNSCVTLAGKSVAIVGSSKTGTVFVVTVGGCTLLTYTASDLTQSFNLARMTYQTAPGIVVGRSLSAIWPHHQDPTTHYNLDSIIIQSLDIENVAWLSAIDSTSSMPGPFVYGAWNSRIANSQLRCGYQTAPVVNGHQIGESFNVVYDNTETYYCTVGWEVVDYSEGIQLNRPIGLGSNVGVRVNNNANKVNGYNVDAFNIFDPEIVSLGSAVQFYGVFQPSIRGGHLQTLKDQNVAAGATTCPTSNSANQAVLLDSGTVGASYSGVRIDGTITTLGNGTTCQSKTDGMQVQTASQYVGASHLTFSQLGTSLNLQAGSVNNEFTGLMTIGATNAAPYVDNGTANAVTYKPAGGQTIVSLH